ncbi:antibiotic resistance protein MarC [Opitutaceae bacterium EW11]|nr:antibiotic resistance protein MarC [Opitutaceae bacterium EW11]
MGLLEYTVFAFSSLFVIVDPVGLVPVFIAMTPTDSHAARVRMARIACLVAAGVLMIFAAAGNWIFRVMGITLPAFQLAGSVLLLRIALDMLYAKRSGAQQTEEEVEAGAAKDDIAIAPLGVPMLAGPGAISSSLILLNQAKGPVQTGMLFACILAVCLATYVILIIGARATHRLSPLAVKLVTRLMGLLLAAVAVQFAFDALAKAPFFAH